MELLYGRHAVLEALRAGRRGCSSIYLGQGAKQTGIVAEIVAAAQRRGCPVVEAHRQTFERAGPVNHQGCWPKRGLIRMWTLDALLSAPRGDAASRSIWS